MENLRNEIVQKLVDAAKAFLKKIKPEDEVLIAHGHDCDSVCSAAIIYKLIKKLLKKEPKLFTTEKNFSVTENDVEKILKLKSNFLIVADISDIGVGAITQLVKTNSVMVIDHHKPKGYARIVYINPRVYDSEIYLPTSHICYKIFESFFDPKEILWIAGVGTLADMGMKNAQDLFQKIKLVDKELVDNLNPVDEELFDNSLLGKLTKIVDSARVAMGLAGVELAIKVLTAVSSYREILDKKTSEGKKLLDYFEVVEKEFKKVVGEFHKNKKRIKNFLVYEIKSKLNMKSPIATYLAKFFDDKILVIMQKEKDFVNVSFRRGKNVTVDLADLSQALVKGIPNSNAGGHPVAAGSGFPSKYAKDFMENLAKIAKG